MTDTRANTNPTTREIPLAAGGDLELRLGSNRLRLRVVDSDRVVVRGDTAYDLERDVEIESGDGWVRVSDGPAGSLRLGPLTFRNGGRAPDLEVDVPRNVRISARTLSGDIEAVDIAGPSRWQSASGTIRIAADAGPVSVDSVSGDVQVRGRAPLAITCRTVSGDVKLWAPTITALDVATTSGDVTIVADLEAGAGHGVTSVSGDLRLVTASEVAVDLQSVTGDIRAAGPHRTDGARGRRTVVIGSGRVRVAVRTMSGDVEVKPMSADASASAAQDAAGAPGATGSFPGQFRRDWSESAKDWAQWGKGWAQWGKAWAEGMAAGRGSSGPFADATPAPGAPAPTAQPAPDPLAATPGERTPGGPVPAPVDAAPDRVPAAPDVDVAGDPRLEETAPVAAPDAAEIEAARLEVLRQLERGELDVETAAARLSDLESLTRDLEG